MVNSFDVLYRVLMFSKEFLCRFSILNFVDEKILMKCKGFCCSVKRCDVNLWVSEEEEWNFLVK